MRMILSSLLLVVAVGAAAANPETLTERSQARARKVLDEAVTALGGVEVLSSIETLRLQLEGETWTRLQMSTPEAPFEAGRFRENLTLDLKNSRVHLEQQVGGAGFEGHNVIVLRAGDGTIYDLRARTATPVVAGQATQQRFVQYYRRLPNLILAQALANPLSLRHLGEEAFEGRKHEVITFVMADTQQVALYVDAKTKLLSKYELIFTDPLTGEDAAEILFSDYAPVGRTKVPQSWVWRVAGDVQARYRVRAELNPPLTDASFEVTAAGFTSLPAAPPPPQARVERLAEGVYVIHNVAGPNQNTLAVAFRDFILAVEAPGTSDGADAVIAKIRETIPGKPIRYVAMTHHHGDHIGGLRSFIAEGASVVTTPANRRVVEALAAAPQKDRLTRSPRKLDFALLESGRRVISDGDRHVELLDIGPNPHAREMVIAWLPKERIVFQGDLFFVPDGDAPTGPPQAATLSFARALEQRRLDVERIASVHGRTATADELREAVGRSVSGGS